MPRSPEHEDFVGLRLSHAMHSAIATAAASLGISKSDFIRAVVRQALRDEQLARAAIDDIGLTPPAYPQFTSALA
jgi:hypothetical protein